MKLCFDCASRIWNLKHYCAIKFGELASVTFEKLEKTYGKYSLSLAQVAHSKHSSTKEISNGQIELMLICFFDKKEISHKEFVTPGQTVN